MSYLEQCKECGSPLRYEPGHEQWPDEPAEPEHYTCTGCGVCYDVAEVEV